MKYFLFSLLFLFLINVYAQKITSNSTDLYVQTIDKNLKSKKLIEKSLDHMSMPGGAVSGYYSGKQLVLIKTVYSGEFGYNGYDFYIKHDSLVFVRERHEFIKVENTEKAYAAYEAYVKSHTDKNGNTDLSKLERQTDDNNIYYLDNDTIIDFQLKSFGKLQKAMEDELTEKNKDLIYRYKTHVSELK